MTKFVLLYKSESNASDLMAKATPEQMQASIEEWKVWASEANQMGKFEFGMPLQPVVNISPAGVIDSTTSVSGYSMIEGDKEEVIELLQRHPNLKRSGASIELMEVLAMPGIEG